MSRFVTSDTHFGHRNIVKFADCFGNPLRPWETIEEHDVALIENWNKVVKPKDKVYHLGDFSMSPLFLNIASKLNGSITLIKGNHDPHRMNKYMTLFDDIQGIVEKDNVIMTHIPIHPVSLERWEYNIHGHLHDKRIDDPRYLCVSVEQTDFAPLPWEIAMERLKEQNNET